MPSFIELDVAGGSQSFAYSISTPTCTEARSIDTNLPTVLFLHPVFIGQEAFASQFNDPQLRRFNLVALDLRGYGRTGGTVPEGYNQEMAADDVVQFMDALKIPPSHIFALSMGTIVGLQLAVSYPGRVLSLFFVSPICLEELPNVAYGRQEIHDSWVDGIGKSQANEDEDKQDKEAITHASMGGMQLAFKDVGSSLTRAYVNHCLPQTLKNWDSAKLDTYTRVTLDFFNLRKAHSVDTLRTALASNNVPVQLIHCSDDVAYPLDYTNQFKTQLEEAGVDNVGLEVVEGSHLGSIEHGHLINPIFYDFLLDHIDSDVQSHLPSPPREVTSPWDAELIKAGWNKYDDAHDSDSDEDDSQDSELEFV